MKEEMLFIQISRSELQGMLEEAAQLSGVFYHAITSNKIFSP